MNAYTCYVVEKDGRSEHTFVRDGKSAGEIVRSLKKEYPGAVVIHVFSATGEESKDIRPWK